MEKSISVYILGRKYTLRVDPKDEEVTRQIAAYVDSKMTAFRKSFPKQDEVTSAVIVALAIAEELFTAREMNDKMDHHTSGELDALADLLGDALQNSKNGLKESTKSKDK